MTDDVIVCSFLSNHDLRTDLYDPKDLASPDPKIRALARKASKNHHNNNPAMSARSGDKKKRQSSVMFAKGTKGDDGPPISAMPRTSTGSAYDGFGALMDEYSDDSGDEDSDDNQPRRQGNPASNSANPNQPRESWGARALAVGERPPDSASQNPPTLKLLALKSQREGGAPIGNGGGLSPHGPVSPRTPSPAFDMVDGDHSARNNPPQRRPDVEQSVSEYGDNSSRIGSTIDFAGAAGAAHAGQGSDGFGGGPANASNMAAAPQQQSAHPAALQAQTGRTGGPQAGPTLNGSTDSRHALTAQLGLESPQGNAQSPQAQGAQGDYFGSRGEVPLSRSAGPGPAAPQGGAYMPPQAPQAAMVRNGPSPYGPNGSPSPPRNPFGDAQAARPLVSPPGGGPGGPPGPGYGGGPGQARGPPPQYGGPRGPNNQGPPPPQPYNMQGGPPPSMAGPGPVPRPRPPKPGFSDAPQQQQRQSLFRRSMAFISGNGDGPQRRPSTNGKRQSLFRRSMAFLSGKPAEPAPEEPENSPAPRVRGFEEKPEHDPRKSQFMGGSGMGDEWDAAGAGAKFWKRFSVAQKHYQEGDTSALTSKQFQEKAQARRKAATVLAGIGGVCIIGAVIGIIVWRESVSSNTDSAPGSINKAEHGGTDTRQRRAPIQTSIPGLQLNYERALEDGGVQDDLWAGAAVRQEPAAPSPTPIAGAGLSKRQMVKRHSHLQKRLADSEAA